MFYGRIQAFETDRLSQNLTVHGLEKIIPKRKKVKLTDAGTTSDHVKGLSMLVTTDNYFKIADGQT